MKVYRYSVLKILFNYIAIFVVLIGCGFVFYIYQNISATDFKDHLMFSVLIFLPWVIPIIAIVVAIINLSRTEIILNEQEVIQKKLKREKRIKWEDVKSIERREKYAITYDFPKKPKDIIITSKDNREVLIHGFLKNQKDAEKDIERYWQREIDSIIDNKAYKGVLEIGMKDLSYFIFLVLTALMVIFFKSYFQTFLSIPYIVIFFTVMFSLYIIYLYKISQISITFTESGLIYEKKERIGYRFINNIKTIPWKSIRSTKMKSNINGPITIETSNGNYWFWQRYNAYLNSKILEEINKRSTT
jgi:hypothetical protein